MKNSVTCHNYIKASKTAVTKVPFAISVRIGSVDVPWGVTPRTGRDTKERARKGRVRVRQGLNGCKA